MFSLIWAYFNGVRNEAVEDTVFGQTPATPKSGRYFVHVH
jgi:hypothetical protein